MTDPTTLDTRPADTIDAETAIDTQYTADKAMPSPLTAAAALAASAALSACGGGGETDASTTGDGQGARAQAASVMTWGLPDTYGAWRFLQQATMGPNQAMVDNVKQIGFATWLTNQMDTSYSNQVTNNTPATGTYARMYYDRGGVPANSTEAITPTPAAAPYGKIVPGTAESEWHRHVTAYTWMRPLWDDPQQSLRHKVVYALSQFLVVSLRHEILGFNPMMVAGYLDMLSANAFGTFRQIIEGVCKSPAMGYYLSHASNLPPKFENGVLTRIPDQNFARELLQLFSIGLTKLNMDGTEVLVNGAPVPTTTTSDIVVLSNVFTGWSLDRSASLGFSPLNMYRLRSNVTATPTAWNFQERDELYDTSNNDFDLDKRLYYFGSRPRYLRSLRYVVPMVGYTSFQEKRVHEITGAVENLTLLTPHSTTEQVRDQLGVNSVSKVTFLGAPLTFGPTPTDTLNRALDRIFAHPNLAPFVAKQMIQHLVTSNPSKAYVQSVATAFKNSGWDMKELLRAILLDSEARLAVQASAPTFGRLKEPYLRVMQMMRAFGVNEIYPPETIFMTDKARAINLNHQYMWAPSVFNDFSPRYTYPGGKMAAKGLVVPQLQIATESAVVAYVNAVHDILNRGLGAQDNGDPFNVDTVGAGKGLLSLKPVLDAQVVPLAAGLQPAKMVEVINERLFGNAMSSELKGLVLNTATGSNPTPSNLLQRFKAAIFLAVVSTEYMVQR